MRNLNCAIYLFIFLGVIISASLSSFGQTTILYQDFEGGPDDWAYTESPAQYNAGGDVWAIVTSLSTLTPTSGTSFWGLQDLDCPNIISAGSWATLTFNQVDISAYTSVVVTFDYKDLGFDNGDDVKYQVWYDGVAQGEVTVILGSNGTDANATETINVPDVTNTFDLVVSAYQNGASDYGMVDNFKIVGIASGGSPLMSVSPSTLTGYTYVLGAGPSTSQSLSLSGTDMDGTQVAITAPTNYEVSTDNSTFSAGVNVSYTAPTLNATTIYVRLKAGLVVSTYNSEVVTCNDNGTAADKTVSNDGSVTAAIAGKILFDGTSGQSLASADWVIDADTWTTSWNSSGVCYSNAESTPQQTPTPAQSGITGATAENYWTGGNSKWAVELVKLGYAVESLMPCSGLITYGDGSNPQDLSNYNAFIVNEPNVQFTAAEKTAILAFVNAGGGLYMGADHGDPSAVICGSNTEADRNCDGWNSTEVWNDLMTGDPFGIQFNQDNTASPTSSNVIVDASDPVLHGTAGNVSSISFNQGATMAIDNCNNATAKGVVFMSSETLPSTNNAMVASASYGAGRVVGVGDSSPTGDGTGDPTETLFNNWADANNGTMILNATIWLTDGASRLVVGTSCLTGFAYSEGAGPSTNQTFTLNGYDLTGSGNITVTGSTNYEVSTDGATFAGSVTYPYASGIITGQPKTVYVRLKAGLTNASSPYNGELIAISGGSATTINVACSGTVTPAVSPTLTSSVSALTGFTYAETTGPSTNQNFTISGAALTGSGNITVTGTTNYEVSTDGTTFAGSVTYPYASGIITGQPKTVYVRLKAGLANASSPYNGETAAISGGSATTINVTCSGTVTVAPTPTLTSSVATLTGFTYAETAGPSTNQNFTISGADLTGSGNITVTGTTNYEVSTDGTTFAGSVTYPYASGIITGQPKTVYVRLKAGLTNASSPYNGETAAISGGSATTINVTCSGTVTAVPAGSANVIITEVVDASSFAASFVEIHNAGSVSQDITGWKLLENNSIIATVGSITLAPCEYMVFVRGTMTDLTTLYGAYPGTYSHTGVGIINGGDYFELTDASSVSIDKCGTSGSLTSSNKMNERNDANSTGATIASDWTVSANTSGAGTPGADNGTLLLNEGCASTPILAVSNATLTGFTYSGSGPSAEQTFVLSGTNLDATDVTLTAPTNYEISLTTGAGYTSPITLSVFDGTNTTIYVRLKAGLGVATYNGEVIAIAGGGDADGESVTCSGDVTAPDVTPPTVTTYSPLNGSTTVLVTDNLVLTFNENVVIGTAGNIVIYNSGGSVFESIPYNDARITFNGTTGVIINPIADFIITSGYYVQIANTAIRDVALNSYVGIADNTTWNFTTTAVTPANVFISEYAGAGFGGGSSEEYFELTNTGGSDQDLTGWTFEYRTGPSTIEGGAKTLSGTIAANSAYLMGARVDDALINGVSTDIEFSGIALNSFGSLTLKDDLGAVVDQVGDPSTDEFDETNNYEFTNCGGDNLLKSSWVNLGAGNGTPGVVNCACTAPATQATTFGTNTITGISMNVTWVRPTGDGVIVVARSGSAVDTDPSSGTTYTGNSLFGSGTQIGTGNYVVYAGTALSTAVANLDVGTTYHYAIYAYNTADMCYNLVQLTGNATTLCIAPVLQASGVTFSGVGAYTTTVSWTRGDGLGVILVGKKTTMVDSNPINGTTYTADAAFGSGTQIGTGNFVLYSGTGTTVDITNLDANSTYHYRLYEYNCSGGSIIYNITSIVNNQATNVASPVLVQTPTSLTGLDYNLGSGPSAAQSFTLSGNDLSAGPITVTAPTNYLVCLTVGGTYTSSVDVTYTSPILNATSVYVKLAGGLPVNTYSGNVGCAGGSATTVNVSVSGDVLAAPLITITEAGPIALGTVCADGGYSTPQLIHVDGVNLVAPIIVDFSFTSAKIEVSSDNITYYTANTTNSLSIAPVANTVNATLYLRIHATSSGGLGGTMYCNSTNATQKFIAFNGSINPLPSIGTPGSTTVAEGANANFSVTDLGLSYQWQQCEAFPSTTWIDLIGETSSSLTVPTVSAEMDQYKYRVYGSNGTCVDTSSSATLTVTSTGTILTCGAQPFAGGTTVPSGWTFMNINTSDAANFGIATPALLMDATGDKVITGAVTAPSVMSFWLKGLGTMTGSALLLEGFNGYSWQTIENITVLPTVSTTKTYTVGVHSIDNYSMFRFTFTKGVSSANLAFDDVDITCGTETNAWLIDEAFDNVSSIATITNTNTTGFAASETGGGVIDPSTITASYNRGGNSLKFIGAANSTVTITTPTFANADMLSFYYRGPSNGSNDLLIEQATLTKAAWTTLATITSGPTYGRVYFYDLASDIIQIRFTYTRSNTTYYAYFDDVRIRSASSGSTTDVKILQTMIQSCTNNEGINESVTFKTGVNPIKVSDLSVSFPTTGLGGQEYSMEAEQKFVTNPSYITSLNDLVHGAYPACSPVVAPPSGVIPANSYAVIFTGRNPSIIYDFKTACLTSTTYYAIFCDNTNTAGRYSNNPSSPDLSYTSIIDKKTGSYDTQYYDWTIPNVAGELAEYDEITRARTYNAKGCEIITTLPVELLSFDANCDHNIVNLSWITATEVNNDYFTIDKSEDMEIWRTVTSLSGAGNSHSANTYVYTDVNESDKTVYYRLKQTDFNGDYVFFDPISVNCDSKQVDFFMLYPNPAKAKLNCEFYFSNDDETMVEIYNAFGQIIFIRSYEIQLGYNKMNFDISDFADGIYYFKFYSADGGINKTQKFVKH